MDIKSGRGDRFSREESDFLLDLVEKHTSCARCNWDGVIDDFTAQLAPGRPVRDKQSLRYKFGYLLRGVGSPDADLVARAKSLASKIKIVKRRGGRSAAATSDDDGDGSDSEPEKPTSTRRRSAKRISYNVDDDTEEEETMSSFAISRQLRAKRDLSASVEDEEDMATIKKRQYRLDAQVPRKQADLEADDCLRVSSSHETIDSGFRGSSRPLATYQDRPIPNNLEISWRDVEQMPLFQGTDANMDIMGVLTKVEAEMNALRAEIDFLHQVLAKERKERQEEIAQQAQR